MPKLKTQHIWKQVWHVRGLFDTLVCVRETQWQQRSWVLSDKLFTVNYPLEFQLDIWRAYMWCETAQTGIKSSLWKANCWREREKSSGEPVHWTEKALLILLLSFRNSRHRLSQTYALETINPVCNMQLLLFMLPLNWNAACLFLTAFLTGSFLQPSQCWLEWSQKDSVICKHLRQGLKINKRHFLGRICSIHLLSCWKLTKSWKDHQLLVAFVAAEMNHLITPKINLQSMGWGGHQAWRHERSLE